MGATATNVLPLILLNVALAAFVLGLIVAVARAVWADLRARRGRAAVQVPACWPPPGLPADESLWPRARTPAREPHARTA